MNGKKAGSASERRSSQALDVFEKAVRAIAKRDWDKARDHLDHLLESFPEEREVLERARAYRVVCERALEKRPAFRPKSFEDLLSYGVYLHNRGEFQDALRCFQQAAEQHPRNEHALYCLAAAASRAGDPAAAVKALRSSIQANPANRAQARSDSDFEPLRDDETFLALVQPPLG